VIATTKKIMNEKGLQIMILQIATLKKQVTGK
jgi:hypothetical protein